MEVKPYAQLESYIENAIKEAALKYASGEITFQDFKELQAKAEAEPLRVILFNGELFSLPSNNRVHISNGSKAEAGSRFSEGDKVVFRNLPDVYVVTSDKKLSKEGHIYSPSQLGKLLKAQCGLVVNETEPGLSSSNWHLANE